MKSITERCAQRKRQHLSQRQRLKAANAKRAIRQWKAKIKLPLVHQWKYAALPTIEFCPSAAFVPGWLERLEYRRDARHDPRFGWYAYEPNSDRVCCRPNLPWRKAANEERLCARGWSTEKLARQAVLLVRHHQFNWTMPEGRAWLRHLPLVQSLAFPMVLRVPNFEPIPLPVTAPLPPLSAWLPAALPVDLEHGLADYVQCKD